MAEYYNNQSFSQMQLDALERMRDMQRRSKSLVFEAPPSEKSERRTESSSQKTNHVHSSSPNNQHTNSSHTADILSNISSSIDSERLLILLILFILYKNNADLKLIIALAYLLI